jgi:hypothetical protein
VLRFYRDTCATLPDEVMLLAGLQTAPDGSGAKLIGLVGCHCGSIEAGEAAFGPVKQFGPPMLDAYGPMPYCALNSMLDGAFPKGALNYWKAQFLMELSDARSRRCSMLRGVPVAHEHDRPRALSRAASRVPVADTACAADHRLQRGDHLAVDRSGEQSHIAWARDTRGAAAVLRRDALRQLPRRR